MEKFEGSDTMRQPLGLIPISNQPYTPTQECPYGGSDYACSRIGSWPLFGVILLLLNHSIYIQDDEITIFLLFSSKSVL